MANATPTIIATTTGADGFETCYVSFKSVVASDGALVGTPTVTSLSTSDAAISDAAITFAGTINGVSYSAGDVLTFVATNQLEANKTVAIEIVYETPKRHETMRVGVKMCPYGI